MSETTEVIRRRVDDGAPLPLWDPPDEGDIVAYGVSTAICDNPECSCTRIYLRIRPARRTVEGALEMRGPVLEGQVSADGSDLKLGQDPTGVFNAGAIEWIRSRLSDRDHRAWLRERWRRARGQVGDPAYPSPVPPGRADWLISFYEVFPYEFDLTVIHDRHLYWADDQYCLQPGCTCDDVSVQFVDASQGGRSLGRARASVRSLRAAEIEGPPLIGQLWNALLEKHGQTVLRKRFQRMRAVARSRLQPPRPGNRSIEKVGRNVPCPCGSGKKFKRCCGA